MDISIHHQMLVQGLKNLTPEELETFKLYLPDCLPRGLLEEADHTIVTDLLVSSHGPYEAWVLSLRIWKMMGLTELGEPARKEDCGLVPAQVLPASSDERKKYQERMREKFQFMRNRNSRPEEHELFQHQFTQLLLLQVYRYKEQKHHELLVQGWEHAEVMEERGKPIEVSALFDPDQKTGIQPHTVVLQGAAGIGKTTLAIKVMLDWAEGKLYQERFDYVFYLTCRELNPLEKREISFADLIGNIWTGPLASMTEIMSKPKRLLFIFDGLDELKFPCNELKYNLCRDWKQQRPVPILLSSLLRKTLLPEASLLLTTRLTALEKFIPLLNNPRHIEIWGFSVKQRLEYFCNFFRDEHLGKKAFSLVEDNDMLLTMCSVPLMSWIVCTCLKQQEERGQDPIQTLKTTTALYMCYINLIIPGDKNFILQHMRGLCRLAAEGIWERKLLFEKEDLRRHNLEAADVSALLDMNIFQKDNEYENCYSFIHLSFQEFFAAMFYLMSTDKEGEKSPDSFIPDVKKLLEECSQHDASFVVLVVRFLFGFLNTQTARELERKFSCQMSLEIKSQLLQWIEGEVIKNHGKSLYFKTIFPECYSHLYETQDAEFVTQALVTIQEIEVSIRYQYEALIAIFCIKHCPGARRILFINESLKYLHLRDIVFEDDGMKLHCEILRKNNCQLETLRITHSGIFGVCVPSFFFALCIYESLKTLDLSFTHLEEGEVKLLCNVLTNQECKLQTLSLAGYDLSGTGSQNLFSALSNNESLKDLDLSRNSLEEDEIKLLCQILENQHCKLEKLSLAWCSLTPMCSQNLFSSLSRNESLKDLDLSQNYFEEGGIKYLCMALENQNCKLEKLSMQSCKFDPTCSQKLLSAISRNEGLKYLDLSHNVIERYSVILLCKALENQNCKLEKLSHLDPVARYRSKHLDVSLDAMGNLGLFKLSSFTDSI
ncbi:NACHT, LRR and PYD domains-containing protein 12-like [Notamacropus eugenii]|uniref:NACHT, LRR and PYD domains-containing protein 12-like n=1 Tax=Notamacropus eugenii TaxID=9315 RepID=UPI003B67B26A